MQMGQFLFPAKSSERKGKGRKRNLKEKTLQGAGFRHNIICNLLRAIGEVEIIDADFTCAKADLDPLNRSG